jgi:fructose-1,6-bisphosphatase/inositol monophosphatase family enzyme
MGSVLSPTLHRLDQSLARELSAMATQAKEWFLTGSGVESLRVRSDGDTTHSFDDALEERLLQFFSSARLPIRFSSEERPDIDLADNPELLALVDPLDGSKVAARGYPMCSIAISIVDMATQAPLLSRIAEVFTGRQYAALHGGHANCDGIPIKPSATTAASDALVVSYFASHSRMSKVCASALGWSKCGLILNYGGPLDIAKVGAGQCDAMIEVLSGMVSREYVAGMHIAQMAGAVATTATGRPIPIPLDRHTRSTFVVAANAQLHAELLELFGHQ